MEKSRAVSLSLVSTLAAAAIASGYGSFAQRQGWQTCIDRNTDVAVDRSYCDQDWSQPQPSYSTRHYGWYYYPRGYYRDAPGIGMHVPLGGSYSETPRASAPMARSGASAVRGGFGSTAVGHGIGGS